MIARRDSNFVRAQVGARSALCAIAFCTGLLGCAGPAATSSSAPKESAAAPEVEREQRLRALQQAEALYLSGRLQEAQVAFEQLTRTYPRNAEIWFRLGNTMMKQGNYDGAATALQNAVSLDPGHGRAALNLALARVGQAQMALDVARARLESNSQERQQADQLQRQIRILLGGPGA